LSHKSLNILLSDVLVQENKRKHWETLGKKTSESEHSDKSQDAPVNEKGDNSSSKGNYSDSKGGNKSEDSSSDSDDDIDFSADVDIELGEGEPTIGEEMSDSDQRHETGRLKSHTWLLQHVGY